MIARIDAAIQKHFDACIHEVMRRTGATKRSLRRHGWCLSAFCNLVSFCVWPYDASMVWVHIFFAALGVTMFFIDDHLDGQAESGGAISKADLANAAWKKTGWFGIATGVCIIGIVFNAWSALNLLEAFAYVFQGYLAGTPPQAPKKQREQMPLTQPVTT